MDIVIRSDAQGVTKDDDFDYGYISGTNQLEYVTDNVTTSTYSEDIKHGQTTGNYQYDALGQLVKDVDERIDTMVWSVTGKVQRIIRNSDEGNDMEFKYGPMDQRVVKITKARVGGSLLPQEDWSYTYYVRDAQGNPIAIYERSFEEINTNMYEDKFALTEVGLYGSKRLGQDKNYIEKISAFNASTTSISVPGGITETVFDTINTLEITGVASYTTTNDSTISEVDLSAYGREIGLKQYELSNHLGNVLQVISDRKFSVDGNTNDTADYYFPDILVCNDYYPFGSLMPGRNANAPNYRYGFQGQEKDDEVKGTGNSYTTEFRQYDSRLGRWLSLDPLFSNFPWQSPYAAFDNNPMNIIDPTGQGGEEPDPSGGDGEQNELVLNQTNESQSFEYMPQEIPDFVKSTPQTDPTFHELNLRFGESYQETYRQDLDNFMSKLILEYEQKLQGASHQEAQGYIDEIGEKILQFQINYRFDGLEDRGYGQFPGGRYSLVQKRFVLVVRHQDDTGGITNQFNQYRKHVDVNGGPTRKLFQDGMVTNPGNMNYFNNTSKEGVPHAHYINLTNGTKLRIVVSNWFEIPPPIVM